MINENEFTSLVIQQLKMIHMITTITGVLPEFTLSNVEDLLGKYRLNEENTNEIIYHLDLILDNLKGN